MLDPEGRGQCSECLGVFWLDEDDLLGWRCHGERTTIDAAKAASEWKFIAVYL